MIQGFVFAMYSELFFEKSVSGFTVTTQALRLAVVRFGCREQDYLRFKTSRASEGRRRKGDYTQDGYLHPHRIHPPGSGRLVGKGTREASGQPLYVPITGDRRDVLPGCGERHQQKDHENTGAGAHSLP